MPNGKEDVLERKRSVMALYLTGNAPEKISEKLAMPVAQVRKDLRSMGIRFLEDPLKPDEQITDEIRQEIELLKQELWSMYMASKNTEEKLKIVAEIRGLLVEKAKTMNGKAYIKPTHNNTVNEKSLWAEVKENFFVPNGAAKSPVQKETPKILPNPEIEVIDIVAQNSCARPKGIKEILETMAKTNGEENPTKDYVFSKSYKGECEKDQEELEIDKLLKRIERAKEKTPQIKTVLLSKGETKDAAKDNAKEKSIREKIKDIEKSKQLQEK